MIKLTSATGRLFNTESIDPASPELCGWLRFTLNSREAFPPLLLDGNGWIKLRDGRFRYSLKFCGLIGYMVWQPVRFDESPDYVGTLGLNEELVIEGRHRTDPDGEKYIELKVFERTEAPTRQVNDCSSFI